MYGLLPQTEQETATDTLGRDMLYGAQEIAKYLGMPRRKAFYMLDNKRLPAFKIGDMWVARKSSLIRYFEDLEKAAKP